MSNATPGNHKHLTLDNRIVIEKSLDRGATLKSIAKELEKDPTTIAKEIRKHRILRKHSTYGESHNKCANRRNCTRKQVCSSKTVYCSSLCKKCRYCNSRCPDFNEISYHCDRTDKAPYVCNACCKKAQCRLDKYFYKAINANKEYRSILVSSREGINISKEDLIVLDELVTPLIMQGQSPYMILNDHPEIGITEKTLYNYIDIGALTAKNIDLAKKVKYKVRKTDGEKKEDVSQIYEGRTYKDFCSFLKEQKDIRVTEMDTVVGCEGSHKVLLTLHFTTCEFMMAYLLEYKTMDRVNAVFEAIEEALGAIAFNRAMPVILTDRGSEFHDPYAIECSRDNTIRTSVFFCDPMCSWQKPHCEKNHEYIRKICPKGTSFDDFKQKDVNLMMSHINSAPRESLGGKTPFQMAKMILPKELLKYFALKEIEPDNVILRPSLLKK